MIVCSGFRAGLLFAVLFTSACNAGSTSSSAESVARQFWSELGGADPQRANSYCVPGTTFDAGDLPVIALEGLGPGSSAELEAAIPTRLTLKAADKPAEVTTYLERSGAESPWQIDCTRTLVQVQVRVEVDAMVERVRSLSDTLSDELEQGAAQLRRTLPALEEGLGRELERVEEEVMRTLPQFMQRLEEFSRAVDETLKKLPGQLPPTEPPTTEQPAPEEETPEAAPAEGPREPLAV